MGQTTTDSAQRYRRLAGIITTGAVAALAGLLGLHSLADLDIWFHLRAGQDLLAGAGFTGLNTYSFTNPGFPWLNHEWMFQILAAVTGPANPLASADVEGWNTLRLLLCLGLVLVLVFGDGNLRRLRHDAPSSLPIFTALITFAGLFLIWPRFNLRPELVSYLLLILVVRQVDQYFEHLPPQHPWRAPALWRLFGLIVLWAQCHGFAILGPVVVLLGILTYPLRHQKTGSPSLSNLLAPLALGILALALTPNLWHGLLFPFRALGQLSADSSNVGRTVSELVPLLHTPNALQLTILAFKLSLVWGVVFSILGWDRLNILRFLLWVAAAGAALANQRSIAIYGLAFVLLQTGSLADWPGPWWRRKLNWDTHIARLAPAAGLTATLLILLGCSWWAGNLISNNFYLSEGVGRRFGTGTTPALYPQAAARALNGLATEHTFANLDAAAFLLGTTQARLYIDGRTEAYPAARWSQYLALKNAGPNSANLLAAEQVQTVVLGLGSRAFSGMAANLVEAPGWQITAAGPGGVLFTKSSPSARPRPDIPARAAARIITLTEPDRTRRADLAVAAANLQQLAGNTDAARQALQGGLTARPDHPTLNHNFGNILMESGEFSAAASHFEQALAHNGRLAGSALNLGACQLQLHQTDAAIRSFRRSLAINPRQVAGWANLATALRNSGQSQPAVEALQKALALQPHNQRLQRQLQNWRRNVH